MRLAILLGRKQPRASAAAPAAVSLLDPVEGARQAIRWNSINRQVLRAFQAVLLVVAAAAGVLWISQSGYWGTVGAITASSACTVAFLCDVPLYSLQLQRKQESAARFRKKLTKECWRYCLCVSPYETENPDSNGEFTKVAQALVRECDALPHYGDLEPSSSMDKVRAMPDEQRRQRFIEWLEKSRSDADRLSHRYGRVAIGFQILTWILLVVGVLAGVSKVAGWLSLNLLALVTTLIGALNSWSQAEQYSRKSESYKRLADDLRDQRTDCGKMLPAGAAFNQIVFEVEQALVSAQ